MDEPKAKSLEEHCDFVCEMTKISFFYAHQRYMRENEENRDIVEIIKEHTPLSHQALRLADKDDLGKSHPGVDLSSLGHRELMDLGEQCPEWRSLMAKARGLVKTVDSSEEFERAMFEHVHEFAMERANL